MEVDVKPAQEQYYVEADSAQISQVLRNIIDNAINYLPDDTKLRIGDLCHAARDLRQHSGLRPGHSGRGYPARI